MLRFATVLILGTLILLSTGLLFYWPVIRSEVKFFRNRAEKHWLEEEEKYWQVYLSRYNESQRVKICKQYEIVAAKIVKDVILPNFEQMRKIYGGAKLFQLNLDLWGDQQYSMYSNMDGIVHRYQYPVSGLEYRGIWLTVFKLIRKYGLEGKCYYENGDLSKDYYIQMNVA